MRWRRWLSRVLVILGGLGLFGGFLVGIGVLAYFAETFPSWTGLSTNLERGPNNEVLQYTPAKTLWDWLNLLLIPVVLTGGGILFTWSENRQARKIEERRAKDAILKNYLDQMTELLLSQGLRLSSTDDEVRSVARARTLTALSSVDGEWMTTIIEFLYEAKLIGYLKDNIRIDTVVDLDEAHLEHAKLEWAKLEGANLKRANLEHINLRRASLSEIDLEDANLEYARLERAKLEGANLKRANLKRANLKEVNLRGADLRGANLEQANLRGADLRGATLEGAWLVCARVGGADLRNADLRSARFFGVNFCSTKLEGLDGLWANVFESDTLRVKLQGANLSGAYLGAAQMGMEFADCKVSLQQLLQAKSLHFATLPSHIDPTDLGDKWSPSQDENVLEPKP